MTDPDLTPAEEREIARLLAGAGGPVQTPPAVAARLDDVLSELVAERGPVTRLSEERARRRRWPRVLLAASAVVVGGYGVSAVVGQGSLAGSDSASDASMPESAAGSALEQESEDDASTGRDGLTDSKAPTAEKDLADGRVLLVDPSRLRSERLDDDVRRLLLHSGSTGAMELDRASARDGCVPPTLGERDVWYSVRLDGRRATLVSGPKTAGAVPATIYSCAGDVLADVVVDVP